MAKPGNSGRHSGHETIFEVFRLDLDTYGSSQEFETGFLHSFSMRIWLACGFGLGSPFFKIPKHASFSKMKSSYFLEHIPQKWFLARMFSAGPQVLRIPNIWKPTISRFPGHQNWFGSNISRLKDQYSQVPREPNIWTTTIPRFPGI